MRTLEEKFESFNDKTKQKTIELAKDLMKTDNFFIEMLSEIGEEKTFISAKGTATNLISKAMFHKKFGERNF